MKKNLPIFRAVVADDDKLGVEAVALVSEPAIARSFIAFSESIKFNIDSEEKRMVTGPLMIAELPIYRFDPAVGEYYIVFESQVIEDIMIRFAENKLTDSVNEEHSQDRLVDGVVLFESWMIDKDKGKRAPKGFKGITDGSWFGTYKIKNDAIWQKVKSGEFTGFSVEGLFDLEHKVEEKPDMIDMIIDAIGKTK